MTVCGIPERLWEGTDTDRMPRTSETAVWFLGKCTVWFLGKCTRVLNEPILIGILTGTITVTTETTSGSALLFELPRFSDGMFRNITLVRTAAAEAADGGGGSRGDEHGGSAKKSGQQEALEQTCRKIPMDQITLSNAITIGTEEFTSLACMDTEVGNDGKDAIERMLQDKLPLSRLVWALLDISSADVEGKWENYKKSTRWSKGEAMALTVGRTKSATIDTSRLTATLTGGSRFVRALRVHALRTMSDSSH